LLCLFDTMAERRVAAASLAVCLLLLAHVALDQSRRSDALFQIGLSVPSQAQHHSALAASRLDVGYVALLSAGGMARTQMLAGKWSRGILAGKASLVTMCAKGDNSACDKLAADPNAIGALEDIDKSNPDGFAAHHPKAFHSLRQEEVVHHPRLRHRVVHPRRAHGQTKADRMAEHQLEMWRAAHRPLPPSLRAYHTSSGTKREWQTAAWKGGALKDMNNARWLRACGEGNYYACKHIGDSNDAIQTLIKGHQSRVIVKVRPAP